MNTTFDKTIQVRLNSELLKTIDSLVDCRQGKTRSHVIRRMILDWLEVNGH